MRGGERAGEDRGERAGEGRGKGLERTEGHYNLPF